MRPLCLVFDLDDTLYLERDYIRSGFEVLDAWAGANLGLINFSLRAWALFERGERGHIFDRILLEQGIKPDRDTIGTMVDLYRGHFPNIQLATDADDCLRNIQGQVHLALVSDGPQQSQRNKIKALGLTQSFETVVLTSTLGNGYAKPHPKAFLQVQQHFGATVQQYTYAADNPAKDFSAPLELGWRTVRIRRSNGLHASVDTPGHLAVEREMTDLSSLTELALESP